MDRCPWAIRYGTTLTTRCYLPVQPRPGHKEHEGRGLERFDYQTVHWLRGDRREFITDREDEFSWEEPGGPEPTEEEKAAARKAVRAMLEMHGVPQDDWPPEVLEP